MKEIEKEQKKLLKEEELKTIRLNIEEKNRLKEEEQKKIKEKEDLKVGCIPTFIQEFEITNDINDYVRSSEIQDWLEQGKYGITMKKFGMEMKQYIIKKKLTNIKSTKKKICGKTPHVWLGIKNHTTNRIK